MSRNKNKRLRLTRKEYQEYLKSDHWKDVKKRYYKSKLFKDICGCCKKHSRIYHLHHKTYKRLGNEYLTDLIAICPKCHTTIHQMLNVKKLPYLWNACKKLRKQLKKDPNFNHMDNNFNYKKKEKIKNILKESYSQEKKLGIKDI